MRWWRLTSKKDSSWCSSNRWSTAQCNLHGKPWVNVDSFHGLAPEEITSLLSLLKAVGLA